MKIYVITSGCFDDYVVHGATTNKYKAEQYKKILEETEESVCVQEYDDLVDLFGMRKFKWYVETNLVEQDVCVSVVDEMVAAQYELDKVETSNDYVGFYIHVMVEAETRSEAERRGMRLIDEYLKGEAEKNG